MNDKDARNRIIKAAIEILDEVDNIETITIRQIAERAGVGVGLVNYHFKSKNNLLSYAVGDVMEKMVKSYISSNEFSKSQPIPKLKKMLKELFNFGLLHDKIINFTLSQSILNGDIKAALLLVPVLKEIFDDKKSEMELRLIATQIVLPIQVVSLNPKEFHLYSGIDLRNENERNKFLESLVDNLIK